MADSIQQVLEKIRRGSGSLAKLTRVWSRRDSVWDQSVGAYRLAARSALDLGEGFLAFNIASAGLAVFVDDLRLLQFKALALARTGSPEAANTVLRRLASAGHRDEETLGLLARTHKDLWQASPDSMVGQKHLARCRALYHRAFKETGGYYSGINAAATALMLGKVAEARRLAKTVSAICEEQLGTAGGDETYWLAATRAETILIEGNVDGARQSYAEAVQSSNAGFATVSSTRSQARLLLVALGCDSKELDGCFQLPAVAAFAGHMFDAAGRKHPRFPAKHAGKASRKLKRLINDHRIRVGYSAVACGGDLLFAEALLDSGGEMHVVLPFGKTSFRKTSVEISPRRDWGRRFDSVLRRAASVTIMNPGGDPANAENFEYCNRVIAGTARLKARSLGVDFSPVVLWDGQAGDNAGGTEAFVKICRRWARPVIIDTQKFFNEPPRRVRASSSGGKSDTIRAMLFADVVGFSKLDEAQLPVFVERFLGCVAEVLPKGSRRPLYRNTWGDALYCVFRGVCEAGEFAMAMRNVIRETHWEKHGLPKDMNVRIGLHAGPVYECHDPVIGRKTYNGFHVNRAARIEPITEEGQIFASQSFAALSAIEPRKEFQCDYAGTRQLPKGAGSIPVFVLRHKPA